MTQSQHTLGPWHVNSLTRIEAADYGLVASIRGDLIDPTTTANARLIAAAPDLLGSLIDLLGDRPSVQGGVCQHCGRDYIVEFASGDCDSDDCPSSRARAAIARAKGLAA